MVKEGHIGRSVSRSVGGTYAMHSVRAAFSNFPHLFLLRRPPPKMDLAMVERRAACLGQIILKLATEQTAIGTREGGRATLHNAHWTERACAHRLRLPPTLAEWGEKGRRRRGRRLVQFNVALLLALDITSCNNGGWEESPQTHVTNSIRNPH